MIGSAVVGQANPLEMMETITPLRAATSSAKILDRMGFFLAFANLSEGVGRFRGVGGVLQLLERAVRGPNLVGFRRVATDFCVGLVASDRLDFVMGAARLGQEPGTSLAQTMR